MPLVAPAPCGDEATRIAARVVAQLGEYFGSGRRVFDVPLVPAGTPFQQEVWRALTRIEFGATTSYGALAVGIGRPRAVRAVGAANGANPIPIIVPCHRVIGANGALTGFAGGLPLKEMLLGHEGHSVVRGTLTAQLGLL